MKRWDCDDVFEDYEDYEDDEDFDDYDYFRETTAKQTRNPQPKPAVAQKPKQKKEIFEKKPESALRKQEFFKSPLLSEFQQDKELEKLFLEEEKTDGLETLHLVVLGHVDAGKSTLMGRLLYELGVISQKAVHKYHKEASLAGKASFSWAWVLDQRPEERLRGVTVDVAMASFQSKKFDITLLDAPGHKDFVPNMITGVAQADTALLVVDGSIGGFESGFQVSEDGLYCGQTREHAQLARSLGIDQIIVVISKLDTCNYSQDRFEEIQSQLSPFLEHCGFRKTSVQWLLASAPSGVNLTKSPVDEPLLSWYKGPTVFNAIDAFSSVKRDLYAPLRLPVNEVLKSRSLGTGINGKIETGAVKVGSKVWILPSCEQTTIKTIELGGKAVKIAKAGDCCDIAFEKIEPSVLHPGCVLCPVGWPIPVTQKFEAKILTLDLMMPILPGLQVSLQCHTAKESARITSLVSLLDQKTSQVLKHKPRCVLKGQTAVIEIETSRALCLEEYSSFRGLGRITLRESSRTIGVGIVTKILQTMNSD